MLFNGVASGKLNIFVIPLSICNVPVIIGLAKSAFKSNDVCCAVDTGLFASEVLLTLFSPTIVAVIPATVPVKAGLAKLAF